MTHFIKAGCPLINDYPASFPYSPAVQMKADAIVVSLLTSIICNYVYHPVYGFYIYICMYGHIFSFYVADTVFSYREHCSRVSLSFIYLSVEVCVYT